MGCFTWRASGPCISGFGLWHFSPCISRVYLGYHTIAQVFARAILGAFLGAVWFWFMNSVLIVYFPAIEESAFGKMFYVKDTSQFFSLWFVIFYLFKFLGLCSWIWVCVLVQNTLRSKFIWFLVFNSIFNFFYLVKIKKINFFNLDADVTFFNAKKHFLLLI